MSGTQNVTGQVLGASTAVLSGVALLPATGGSALNLVLPIVSISCGILVLSSLIITRLITKRI